MTDVESYVLNIKNTYIRKHHISAILNKFNVFHSVKNIKLFQRAMVHSSYLKISLIPKKLRRITSKSHYEEAGLSPVKTNPKIMPLQDKSYERLEYLGDAIVHAIIAGYLFDRFPEQKEGFMTTLRTQLESSKALSSLSLAIGLNHFMVISRIIEVNGGRTNNTNILEDIFESFMGALYKDAGYDVCNQFLTNIIQKEIDIPRLLQTNENYKDILLRLFHRKKWTCPKYMTIAETGPDHNRTFEMGVYDNNKRLIGKGKGVSKKRGEQLAAKQALIYLGELNEDSDSDPDEDSDEESTDE